MSSISAVSGSGDAWAAMKAHRAQMQDKMFAKADTDGSGGVDKTELQGLMDDVAKKTGVASSTSADDLFSKLDTDGNGSLSKDELAKGMKDILPPPSTMDFAHAREGGGAHGAHGAHGTNGAAPPSGATGSADAGSTSYDPLDTNKDGVVSALERLAGTPATSATDAVQALFKAVDTDGDGNISSSESDAFIQQLQQASTDAGSSAQSSGNSLDLASLVKQIYAQIAGNMSQQAKGATLSAVA